MGMSIDLAMPNQPSGFARSIEVTREDRLPEG
jgi:hypothetical protein